MSSLETRVNRDGSTSYRVRFHLDGRRGAHRTVTFDTAEAAKDWRTVLDAVGPSLALAQLAVSTETTTSLAGHMASYIEHLTGVTEGTKRTYRAYVTRDMVAIGRLPLESITRDVAAEWVNSLAARGLSGKSIRNRHGLLSAALSAAVEADALPSNPVRRMRLPRTDHETTEMTFLTPAEFEHLYALIPPRYQPLVLTLVGTGMRWSEATALTAADVDLAHRSIRVRQAWKMTGTAARSLGPTKTRRSKRTVAVPSQVVEALRPLVEGRPASALVFTNAHDGPVKQATFWRLVWAPAVRRFAGDTVEMTKDNAGRPVPKVVAYGPGKHPRVHDLRHSFASWGLSNRVPMATIQRQLGHESITTTVDRYGHLARSDFDALADSTGLSLPTISREITT